MAKLRPTYQAFIIMFFSIVVLNGAHLQINQNYGAQNKNLVEVNESYKELENAIRSDNPEDPGLVEKLKALSDPLDDVGATIGAGLFIIPQLIGVLTAPLDIGASFLTDVQAAFGGFIPPEVTNFLVLMLSITIAFGLLEAYLRMNEA
jgi:hypothetical protein